MSQITPELLRTLRTEIDQALADIAKKHNVDIKAGSASYSANNGSMKLEISAKNENGETLSKTAEDFKRYASLHGFKPEHLGQTFVVSGKTFKITGFNTKASKMPIEATCAEDGKSYKFATTISRLMK